MSRDTLTQACSFHCKICGRLTASRSRWHVDNEVCEDYGCDQEVVPEDPEPQLEKADCLSP